MSDDIKQSLIWATVAISAIISIPWSISYYHSTVAKTAIEAGLEQRTLPGQSGVHWVKSEAK